MDEDDRSNKDANIVYFDITCYLAILSLSVKAIKTFSIIILEKSAWSEALATEKNITDKHLEICHLHNHIFSI